MVSRIAVTALALLLCLTVADAWKKRTRTLRPGSRCSTRRGSLQCPTGFHCVGKSWLKKCLKPMGLGKSCKDPFWVCHDTLKCCAADKICKKSCAPTRIPVKGRCGGRRGRNCATGSKCVGRKGRERCMLPMGPGKKCSDPWWYCRSDLKCCGGKICKKTCVKTVGPCGRCGTADTKCLPGYKCAGKGAVKLCMKEIPEGRKCNIGWGMRCSMCVEGANCVGPAGRTLCKKPMGPGGKCSDPFWKCRSDLKCCGGKVCRAQCITRVPPGGDCSDKETTKCAGKAVCCAEGRKHVCKNVLKEGDNCTDSSKSKCPAPLRCEGVQGGRHCVKLMGPGGLCHDPFWVCKDGLECDGKYCREPVTEVEAGGSCADKTKTRCKGPLKCCARGSQKDTCQASCKKILKEGDNCTNPDDGECMAPTRCEGVQGGRHCVKLMDVGGLCHDPFWVCKDHLKCDGKFCVEKH